ncbi:MAG: hypothetical protein ACRCV0_06210, partial [Brevinema sp.]
YSSIDKNSITEYYLLQEEIKKNPYFVDLNKKNTANNELKQIQKQNKESLYVKWKEFNFIQEVDKKQRFEVY